MFMANLKVNTDRVLSVAEKIEHYNMQLRDDVTTVQNAVAQLDNSWEGEASAVAIRKFGELRDKYLDARYSAMNNYANFLRQQVSEGYTQTETVNKSLAEKFK